ncbi:hypothetical protein BC833DRAFT_433748 [Globomyces pollinis-pini]|nr:hypothetical protein BC833DRAFT_433748 [Globomyces pollinis-pini]
MNSQIWFQLVDFDGKPYKRTTVAKVTLLCSADVDDLRNAVKAQCPNTLASVDAGILLVYENKMAFNQRNALSPFLALESVFREPGFNRGDSPLIILVPPIYPEPLSTSVSGKIQTF